MIFVCNLVKPDNVNTTEYQRVQLLAASFEVAVLYRRVIPDVFHSRFREVHRIRGGVFFLVHGLCLIAYLRIFKGYKVVYTSPETFGILWGALSKSLLGCKWIYDLWDHPSLEITSGRPLVSQAKRFAFKAFLWNRLAIADGWIVGMHKGILRHLPGWYPANRIVKVTNGLHLPPIDRVLEKTPDTRVRSSGTVLRVGYAGPVTWLRGMQLILQSLECLSGRYHARIDLYGEGEDEVLEAIDRHNQRSPHKVHYHGYVPHEEVLTRLAESEACLCLVDPSVLSFEYAYAIKLFEYLALGQVVVASRTIANAEIIDDGHNGFLASYSVEGLSSTLTKIIDMKEREDLEPIKRAARETAKSYLWEDINYTIQSHLNALLKNDA